jgi:hypothetical protein
LFPLFQRGRRKLQQSSDDFPFYRRFLPINKKYRNGLWSALKCLILDRPQHSCLIMSRLYSLVCILVAMKRYFDDTVVINLYSQYRSLKDVTARSM